MLHSFDDTKTCYINGKPIANTLRFVHLQKNRNSTQFMCLSAFTGNKKARGKPVMSGSANHIDPAPDLRAERVIVARHLTQIGDNLLESYDTSDSRRRICFALSIAAAGLVGVTLYLMAKDKE